MDVENLAKELILKNMTPEQQMAVLDSVRQSVANAKEVQKKKIGENVDLVVQALKKIESDIRDRFDAVGNSIEKRVLSIQDGRDGSNGKDGRDGKDGKSGRDGLKGDRGVDGQAGRDGVDGVDGISVVNAQIDFDGSLVISLSDGRELNVGEVVSQDIAEKIKVISTMSTNGAVGIKDEGSSISTGVKTINFVGATVTATNSGDDVTVNVSAGTGTVTSVGLSGGTTGLTTTGSPITTTGTITLGGTLAVASGGTGTATPSLVAGTNITSITGTWPNQTINASGGAGTVTSVAATGGTGISVSGSPITTTGTLTITNTAPDQTVVLTAGTGISTSGTYPSFTVTNSAPDQTVALTQGGTTTITGTYPNFTISSADQFQGTVTSVTGTSPVASSGGATPAISLAANYGDTQNPYASKTANYVLAAPNGSAGAPTFRAIVAADIPTLNQNTTGSAATVTTTINSGVVATTQTSGDNSTKVATTAYVNAITGTNGITGFKNRIINGAMVIDQRNAGASITPTNGQFSVDRWKMNLSQASKYTAQQNAGSVTPPTGFANYLGITSSSAYSVLAADSFYLYQAIEGYNIVDLGFGTANASTVTLSFWVRSSLTGSFGGTLAGYNGSTFRSYPFSYTISSANTWEQKTITIAGDTTTFAYDKTNSFGLFVIFSLGVGTTNSGTANSWTGSLVLQPSGSTSVVGTSGATFYITGVQLEKGSTATSFDYRPYGTELALCQRYYIRWTGSTNSGWPLTYGFAISTTNCRVAIPLNIPMRSTPTASFARLNWNDGAGGFTITLSANLSSSTVVSTQFATTGLTAYRSGALGSDGTSPAGYYDADSEL
jgi:hypothetical protein